MRSPLWAPVSRYFHVEIGETNTRPRNKVDLFVKKSHYPAYLPANNMTSKMDEANAGLISKQQQQQQPRVKTRPPPGKCTLARKRLRQVFNMRKYYLSIIGLTGFEAVLVLCRVILETESLRFPVSVINAFKKQENYFEYAI
ncbi:unnamed protein product [Trichobilharzia regenti]|nr:unnamed protein product [Trichobilharzia regenti]